MKIDRTLFWFADGDETLTALNEGFFGLAVLINRLLNENYDGKKIKFINLEFSTIKTYDLHPILPKCEPYYYGGHLKYFGVFDREEFDKWTWPEKQKYIWDEAFKYLVKSAKSMKNEKLLESAEKAHIKGIGIGLNPDYRVVETYISFLGKQLKAAVWINFKEDGMYSKFTLEKGKDVLFEKHIDKTKNGVEFFLEIYKDIELVADGIIIKGSKDVEYLPLKIPFEEILLKE